MMSVDKNKLMGNDIGAVFQQARQHKKLTVEEVSNAIHLSERQILALEGNDFNALPEPAITRGFIRNYGNFLEVEVEPLLTKYRSLVPEELRSLAVKANVNEVMSRHQHQPWLLYVLGAILVLLFLTAWFYYMDSVKTPETSVEAEEAVVAAPDAASQQPQMADETASIQPNTSTSSVPFVSTDSLGNQSNVNPVQSPATITQTNQNQPIVAPVVSVPPALAKKLEMIFDADSWVQVKDKNGLVILEKTATAGSTEVLDGEQPFKVIIGNAVGAKVKYYGQEVDLTSATSRNIIRLNLE